MAEARQTPNPLDQMRAVLRVHRYALRTERAYCDWVRRYVKFHGMRSPENLAGGTQKVEVFLRYLAVEGQVAPSTQNQALNALLFLYGRVLEQPLEERINAWLREQGMLDLKAQWIELRYGKQNPNWNPASANLTGNA